MYPERKKAPSMKAAAASLLLLTANIAMAQDAVQEAAPADEAAPQTEPAQAAEETSDPSATETAAAPAETSEASMPAVDATAAAPESETASTIPVADSAPVAPLPAEESGVPTRLDDVVVTSTKREKSLRDIPQSISSFNGDDLETQGKSSLSDYIEHSPGVTMNTIAPGLLRITIRGIGVETNPLSSQPSPTGIFINDTAFSDPYINGVQPDLSAFDLASVELLKGPQGTLFGGSALSGAVRYILQDPVMGEWQAKGFTQYVAPEDGSAALTSGVTVNLPLYKDSLAVRLGYVKRKYPGVTDVVRSDSAAEDVDGAQGEQLRALLTWQPLDELTFKFVHLEQDFASENTGLTARDREHRENDSRVLAQPVKNDFSFDTATLEYQWDTVKFTSLTSQTKKNLDVLGDGTASLIGKPPEGYPALLGAYTTFLDNAESKSQEYRLQSTGDSNFQWLVGAYLYKYKVFFDLRIDTIAHRDLLGPDTLFSQVVGALGLDPQAVFNETGLFYAVTTPKATEKALFFDLSYKLWDALELSAGARVYETEVKGGFRGVGVVTRVQNNGPAIDYSDNSIKEDGVSPKFSALLHATDHLAFYAQAARGFRFGGLQSVPSTPGNDVPRAYKSDTLWNYEIGTRTNWLDNTLHLDLTAFYIDYKNPQIGQATTGVFSLAYTDNVGGAQSTGLELSTRWLTPISGLSVGIDAGVTDAHTTEEFETSDGTIVPAGTQMPGSSKSSYSGSLAYLLPVGPALIGATLDYAYIGKGFSDLSGNPNHAINDYGTLNFGITIGSEAWALRPQLALNVSNILNVTAAKNASTTDPLLPVPGYDSFLLNPPRTFTARLSLSF